MQATVVVSWTGGMPQDNGYVWCGNNDHY